MEKVTKFFQFLLEIWKVRLANPSYLDKWKNIRVYFVPHPLPNCFCLLRLRKITTSFERLKRN